MLKRELSKANYKVWLRVAVRMEMFFGSGKERGGKLETTKKMDMVLVAT